MLSVLFCRQYGQVSCSSTENTLRENFGTLKSIWLMKPANADMDKVRARVFPSSMSWVIAATDLCDEIWLWSWTGCSASFWNASDSVFLFVPGRLLSTAKRKFVEVWVYRTRVQVNVSFLKMCLIL